jgi:hypothetical protein
MPQVVPNPRLEVVLMDHNQDPALLQYPHGRGYGHDYMRGGEVFGGYGYAEREEYTKTRGELSTTGEHALPNSEDPNQNPGST